MVGWKHRLIRIIGAVSSIVGLGGLLLTFRAVLLYSLGVWKYPQEFHFRYTFPFMAAVSITWFSGSLVSGVGLRRGSYRGYALSLALCEFQVLYFLFGALVFPLLFGKQGRFETAVATAHSSMVLNGFYTFSYAVVLLIVLYALFGRADFQPAATGRTAARDQISQEIGSVRPMYIWLARILGGLNVAFGFLGCLLVIANVSYLAVSGKGALAQGRESQGVFIFETVVNLGFVVTLSYAGYLLARLRRKGMVISMYVLAAEMIYWVGNTLLGFWFSGSTSPELMKLGAIIGRIGDFGITPQIITAYPIVALLLLWWGKVQLDRHRGWCEAS